MPSKRELARMYGKKNRDRKRVIEEARENSIKKLQEYFDNECKTYGLSARTINESKITSSICIPGERISYKRGIVNEIQAIKNEFADIIELMKKAVSNSNELELTNLIKQLDELQYKELKVLGTIEITDLKKIDL